MSSPPFDRWRFGRLAVEFNELWSAADTADFTLYPLSWVRAGRLSALEGADPFVSAVLAMDRAVHRRSNYELDDAEYYIRNAEHKLIEYRRGQRLRETPRYKQIHARICALFATVARANSARWEGGVIVREMPFDGGRVEELRKRAIEYYEDDDPDAAERTCLAAEQIIAGAAA